MPMRGESVWGCAEGRFLPRLKSGGSSAHDPEEDFRNHPALRVLVLDRKYVLVSKGPIFDALLLLDPRSAYSPANRDHAKYGSLRIPGAKMRRILADYAECEWNGTVYGVAQSA